MLWIKKVLKHVKELDLNVYYTFTFNKEIIKWNLKRKKKVSPGCKKKGCFEGYQK